MINWLTVVGLRENPQDFAKDLETEMYGRVVPHVSGNLFVEVIGGDFEYSTKREPELNALIELSKKYREYTFLLAFWCSEIERRGQVVIRNGAVLESIHRIGDSGLFDAIKHPVIDLFAPYRRERTLSECAEDRLHDAIGIVRGLITIMEDKRFKNSVPTPYNDVRDKERTQEVSS